MKKHSPEEVLAKLSRAQELAERGLSQVEICSALGVSVMTFHRWRKGIHRQSDPGDTETAALAMSVSNHGKELQRLRDLQFENQQLRKLVTDLMLEKLNLQEMAISASSKVG